MYAWPGAPALEKSAQMVPIAALRRLLRRLDDPQELRTNPLAAPYVAGAQAAGPAAVVERTMSARIRAAVVAAIDALEPPHAAAGSHGARQRAILTRCDLRGEKHENVARDLGISRREFYRERRRAQERLALALQREFSAPVEPARIRPSEFELRMQYASSLRMVGHFEAALKELELAHDAPAEEAVRALCRSVEIACDAGDAKRATRALHSARLALAACGESHPVLEAAVALSDGMLCWHTGNMPDSLRAYERALQRLRSASPNDHGALEIAIAALLAKADVLSESGRADDALAALGEAALACDRLAHPSPLLRGDLAAAYGSAHALMRGGLSPAIDELQEAFSVYQRHHAIRRAAKASMELCVLFMQRENYEDALSYGRTALGVARSVCGSDEAAYMCLNLSYAEARSGNATAALALTKQARMLVTEGGFVAALCGLAEAEARLAARQCGAAIRTARAARAAMTRLGGERYVGAALRIEAEAQEQLGETAAARASISAAVEALERFGHAFSLVQAYRCSARLTSNRKHRQAAAELMTTLLS